MLMESSFCQLDGQTFSMWVVPFSGLGFQDEESKLGTDIHHCLVFDRG